MNDYASVKSAHIESLPCIGCYNGNEDVFVYYQKSTLYGCLEFNGKHYAYECNFLPGYITNYASVPKKLQWFLPSYVMDDPVYNSFAALHDWLYSVKGDIGNGIVFSRSVCDDIFRSGLRESSSLKSKNHPRIMAGIANVGLRLFAGGKAHWGNDSYNCKRYCTFSLTELPK